MRPVHRLPISGPATPMDIDIVPRDPQRTYPRQFSRSNGKHQSQYRTDKATDVCFILFPPERDLA